MDGVVARTAEELTREELHKLVWQMPLSRLGPQLGMDGPGLAALCKRRRVPYPLRGYWSKLAVGKAPPASPLPSTEPPEEQPDASRDPPEAEVAPPSTRSRTRGQKPAEESSPSVEKDDGLDPMDALHPKVKAWLAEHRAAQKESERKIKQRRREGWGWHHQPLPDLTARDLYRLRAASTLCHAVEAAGGSVKATSITGELTFGVGRREIVCAVAEKLTMGLSRARGDEPWTAYPRNNDARLGPSGFLRATITTWLPGRRPEWVESARRPFAQLAPEIVAVILACDVRLTAWEREREAEQKRWREEEARRQEERRRQEIDSQRWSRFQACAESWEERDRLLGFVAELRRRLDAEGDTIVEDQLLSEWIAWADARVKSLDPFQQGLRGLFEGISRPAFPAYR